MVHATGLRRREPRSWRSVLVHPHMAQPAEDRTLEALAPGVPSVPGGVIPDLRTLFEEHVDHVGNSLRRLGVRDADIPDLVQEVFVVMHAILPDYDPSRPIWPWIFGVLYRVAASHRRKVAREILDDGALTGERADSSQNLDEAMRKGEDRQLVLEALQHVELSRRAVFVMADIDDVPVPEIARGLGIALNTAYSRLRLAREDFREAASRLLRQRGDQ